MDQSWPVDVVEVCRHLLRIDTTNPGRPERPAAEYVAAHADEAGFEPVLVESEPGRASLVSRIEGSDPALPALVVHGHLDVVPAEPADWTHHPFAGEEADGYLWGRGAVDMKDMVAMMVAVQRRFGAEGTRPRRDLVFAYFADEEAGGAHGAGYVCREHPDLFEGAAEAIGEVGGFSLTLASGLRLYPVQVAEKGQAWMRLRARGRQGHGSMPHQENPVTALCEAVARLGRSALPSRPTPAVEAFLAAVRAHLGLGPGDDDRLRAELGSFVAMLDATVRNTVLPTVLQAGTKVNVIPSVAEALVDGRFLPGCEEAFLAEVAELCGPGVEMEFVHHSPALEFDHRGPLVDAMQEALRSRDPEARTVPYLMSGATDAKHLATLGITGYGFSPVSLPSDLDFLRLFHGVDERVPVAALSFGADVLWHLLTRY